MDGLTKSTRVLQNKIDADDVQWRYTIRDIPGAEEMDAAGVIKSISVVSSFRKERIELGFQKIPLSRATSGERLHKFMLINFGDFRLRATRPTKGVACTLASSHDSRDYIARFVKTGVELNGIVYHFFGHSGSQLQSKSCFMYAANKSEISRKIEAMGDFSELRSVGKKAKRIGLLFSIAHMALQLPVDRYEEIDDVTAGGRNFTDGCGLISPILAKQLVQRHNIMFRNQRYLPSVFQIRYRGYKGVLTLWPEVKGHILAKFRRSMGKFKDSPDLNLAVVDYARPYAFGFLNDEIVLLMKSLGIATTTLLRKQNEYLAFLERAMRGQPRECFQFLSYLNEVQIAETLLLDGPSPVLESVQRLVRREFSKMLTKKKEQRCRIMIPQSRLLFGVCDPTSTTSTDGVLKPGTCFVRITLDGDGEARTIVGTEVLVTRNPCLHPGDLQKFKTVDAPQLAHLVDCIVFPTRGKRPSADMMSGGDLDGDRFFVTWDPDIIPKTLGQAALYPTAAETVTLGCITGDDRADYFAGYNNDSLSRVKSLHLKWARLKGPMSSECQQLNRIFSQCVDGAATRVPQSLEDPPMPPEHSASFILDDLHLAARETIEVSSRTSVCHTDISVDMVDLLLSRDKISISEFELVQSVLRWCTYNGAAFSAYAPFFDFSALSDEQQIWLLGVLPAEDGLANLVRNCLHQSQLLSQQELARFSLDHHFHHWRPVFDSSSDRMGRFLSAVCRSLELFHKKLIVLRPDDRLTIAIYIAQKIPSATEVHVNTNVRVFAFPRAQEITSVGYKVVPTKVDYRLYCTDRTFQLYQGKRGNTFVYLTKGQTKPLNCNGSGTRGGARRRKQETLDSGLEFDCRASIALDKISADVQTHVGRLIRAGVAAAEIYVISNRDRKSMQLLDEWLNLVDTEEVLPLFASDRRRYTASNTQNITLDTLNEEVTELLARRDQVHPESAQSLRLTTDLLDRVIECGNFALTDKVFRYLLEHGSDPASPFDQIEVARWLLRILPHAPFLTLPFFRSQVWQSHKESLQRELSQIGLRLLECLISTARTRQDMVREPLNATIHELSQLTLQDLSHIFELVALCIKAPQLALDLLTVCIETQIDRLLRGRLPTTEHFTRQLIGVVMDYVESVSTCRPVPQQAVCLTPDRMDHGFETVKASIRIDSPLQQIRVGEHVQLQAAGSPQDAPLKEPHAMDAILIAKDLDQARFRCLQRAPPYLGECDWEVTRYGCSVTLRAMLDAVVAIHDGQKETCVLHPEIVDYPQRTWETPKADTLPFTACSALDQSENAALKAAMECPLSLIWAPPGSKRMETIATIVERLLQALPDRRILVTAPTDNAVDSVLRRFVRLGYHTKSEVAPLRVATNLSQVATDLWEFTRGGSTANQDLNDPTIRDGLNERVQGSRLVFTTCDGLVLGLFQPGTFQTVVINDASRQTEPASLLPLTTGCSRAILVGDHQQMRPRVQKHAQVAALDISLFERLYKTSGSPRIAKIMLETQYRMHPDVCNFSSANFYEGKLGSAKHCGTIAVTPSAFPWPRDTRRVFVQCASAEDLGGRSKTNQGQANVCRKICNLLLTHSLGGAREALISGRPDVAVLTPYAEQRARLRAALPTVRVSTIEDFQSCEAQIVVLVSVRCNVHASIGCLGDLRQLNVAVTRANAGLIIVGDRATLTDTSTQWDDHESKAVWKELLEGCVSVTLRD